MIHYFAYGSNLHPVRLMQRAPSATLVGVAAYSRHSLTFHKKSNDGSSKCNMLATGARSDLIYGAIYRLEPDHKHALDKFEGNGYGYTDGPIELRHQGQTYTCHTYFAQESHIDDDLKPYHWYKQLVTWGARYLRFPGSYIASIEAVESIEDPNMTRRRRMDELIEKVADHP